jgi:formylglycine-generating enzyme required for sulfatase activity
VDGGTFNRQNDANYPATLSSFRLDTYEVTVGRFRKFAAAYAQGMIAAGAGRNVNNPTDPGWDAAWNASLPNNKNALKAEVSCDATYQTWTEAAGANERLPMNCLSWYVAQAFCIWDGGRLPTETEWNYAAAGGSEQRLYPWGATGPGTNASQSVWSCYYNGTGQGTCTGTTNIAPVGSIGAGVARWGQLDMSGNVLEWTQDVHDAPYQSSLCIDCAKLSGVSANRSQRGGSFQTFLGVWVGSHFRSWRDPAQVTYANGVRCARTN